MLRFGCQTEWLTLSDACGDNVCEDVDDNDFDENDDDNSNYDLKEDDGDNDVDEDDAIGNINHCASKIQTQLH